MDQSQVGVPGPRDGGSVVRGRSDVVAGLLGPFQSVRRGQAEQASEVGVAQADLEQPAGGPRRRLVRRAVGGSGIGQRRGVERGSLGRRQPLPVRLDPSLGGPRAGLCLPGRDLPSERPRAAVSRAARAALASKPAGGA